MSKVQEIFRDKTSITKHVQIKYLFFLFLFGDFNISNIFYKIQRFNKWQLVSVITHWTYSCLNLQALQNINILINLNGFLQQQVNLNKGNGFFYLEEQEEFSGFQIFVLQRGRGFWDPLFLVDIICDQPLKPFSVL